MAAVVDAEQLAEEAGLRYVSDDSPGYARLPHGRGFTYRKADGTTITDRRLRQRLEDLVIPPAWTDVWISPHPNGHILATGRDAKGRKQYLYHPTWRAERDAHKFDQLLEFGTRLPDLRRTVDENLGKRFSRIRVLSLVVRLLDETLIRVGNAEYAETNHSYGLTTLSPDHVMLDDDGVEFEFVGKSGLQRALRLADTDLAALVRECHELGGQELFCYRPSADPDAGLTSVTSSDVNDFLREHLGEGVSAKTFRTWGATKIMAAALALDPVPETETEAEKELIGAYDVVASVLGNTRAVARASYVHPVVPEAYTSGELRDVWRRSRRTRTMDRAERCVLKLLQR